MDPSVGDAVSHLSREWRSFLDAPLIFITGGAAIAGAMWALMKRAFGARLASKDERITARDETITWLESEVDRFKREADWLGREVNRLTPLPLRFVLEDITRMKGLDDFVKGVRNRTEDIATRAATFGGGFPGLRETLRASEAFAQARTFEQPNGMAPFSPEMDKVARQSALDACRDLHRTASELVRYLVGGKGG
jgi:hypothetical protein